jgi:hypothetical protein
MGTPNHLDLLFDHDRNLVLKAMVTSGSCHFKYITSFFSQRPAAFRFTGFDKHAVGKVRDCSSPRGLKRSGILAA